MYLATLHHARTQCQLEPLSPSSIADLRDSVRPNSIFKNGHTHHSFCEVHGDSRRYLAYLANIDRKMKPASNFQHRTIPKPKNQNKKRTESAHRIENAAVQFHRNTFVFLRAFEQRESHKSRVRHRVNRKTKESKSCVSFSFALRSLQLCNIPSISLISTNKQHFFQRIRKYF